MKKRKGRLLNRTLAMLLAAVLTVGMVSNAVPASVLAQEESGTESVSANDVELTEEETEPAEGTEPIEKTEPGEPVEGTGNTVEIGQEQEEEETQGSVSENPAADEENGNLQALLERIAALPDAEEYLAMEPDADSGEAGEDAYAEWMAGLYAHAEEALAIQEAVAALSEEEQAEIPEETLAKLAAWAEIAGQAAESSAVMAAEGRAASGDGWSLDDDGKLTITTNDGTTAWRSSVSDKTQVKSVEIQDGVTSIGSSAFYGCSSLESITIPSSVTSIASHAFSGCSSLKGITMPSSVTSIGENAFYECSSLESITIPSGVTIIELSVFAGCSSLTSITIPSSITNIKDYAFSGCTKLANVTMAGETPPSLGGSNVFYSCPCVAAGTKGIHVPTGRVGTYQAGTGWSTYKDHITDGTTAETHEHNGVTFTAWTATDSLPTDAGNYYLTENVTLSDTWNVPSGTTSLCLNGNTISASGEYSVITIAGSDPLNLYDCQDGGNITGGQEGGVFNEGTFHMYGGKISGNGRASYGGGVWNTGTFIMYGGVISGNSAFYNGGGVYVGDGTFCMYGGNISGNSSSYAGGGVYVRQGIFIIGGSAGISGNVYNDKENNVYLKDGVTITIDSDKPLSGSAKIGVTTQTAPTDGNPVNITGANGADYSKYFTSDNADYKIVNGGGNVVQLAPAKSDFDKLVETMQIVMAALNDYKATNETTEETIQDIIDAAINEAGITGAIVEVRDFQKTEATSEAEGSIQAKIYVECGTRNNTGVLTAKIDRLQPSHTHTLTLTEAKDATCTEEGNSAYYTCSGCGKYFTDAAGTSETTLDSVKISALGHDYNTSEWGYKGTDGHAHKCRRTGCDAHDTVVAHTPGAAATATTPQTCTVCGYVITPELGHQHVLIQTAAKDATCTETGNRAYYTCEGCGKLFSDAAGTDETTLDSVKTAALGHAYGEWTVTKEATETTPGTKERICGRCGHKETASIPATGGGSGGSNTGSNPGGSSGSGNSSNGNDSSGMDSGIPGNNDDNGTDNENPGGNGSSGGNNTGNNGNGTGTPVKAPTTVIITLPEELEDAVLTEAGKQQKAAGADIRIELDVTVEPAAVSAADRALVEAALNGTAAGYTVGCYLDISLYQVIGDSRTAITETDGKITIRIDVPERLKNTDPARTRTFAVIRVHEGRAEFLTDLDDDAATITIATDRFSTYALVYQDTAAGAAADSGAGRADSGKDDEPKTGDTTPVELCATLAMIAGLTYLLLYFTDRRHGMSEETKKELVAGIVAWAKRGGKLRRYLALAVIFFLLVYYHSIGKRTCVEWKEIYGE